MKVTHTYNSSVKAAPEWAEVGMRKQRPEGLAQGRMACTKITFRELSSFPVIWGLRAWNKEAGTVFPRTLGVIYNQGKTVERPSQALPNTTIECSLPWTPDHHPDAWNTVMCQTLIHLTNMFWALLMCQMLCYIWKTQQRTKQTKQRVALTIGSYYLGSFWALHSWA